MNYSPIVAMSKDFLTKLNKEKKASIKQQVNEAVTKFQNNPTSSGLNFETIKNPKNPNYRSIRVNDDVRIILLSPSQGNVYLFCIYDQHDKAYKWAETKQCKVNAQTGSVQIFSVEEMTIESSGEDPQAYQGSSLFDDYKDDDLMMIGCPEELIPKIRNIKDLSHFFKLEGGFPDEVYEMLSYLSEGIPLAEVKELVAPDMGGDEVVNVDDFEAALKRPQTRHNFWVAEDEHQLAKMLNAPLEQWRVFLHPTQRKLATRHCNGPVRVLGGAGTGKTVVAMHRAAHLVEKVFNQPTDRVLFTTFTKNLAYDIGEDMKTLVQPAHRDRVEVTHINDWVHKFLKRQGYGYQIRYFDSQGGERLRELWNLAISGSTYSPTFLREEWDQVIQYHGVTELKAYYKVKRSGRGSRLSKMGRYEVWQCFTAYRSLLDEHQLKESQDAIRDARLLLEATPHLIQYRSVIVDEAQDLSPETYRLLRALTPVGANDLFIVGDGHQRIYRYRVSLKRCGVHIVGRSYRLRLNYRTTEEIRRYAVQVLEGLDIDDLDGGSDTLQGYHSLLHGEPPQVQTYQNIQDEVDHICRELSREGVDPARCCVVARTQKLIDLYRAELNVQDQEIVQIKRSLPTSSSKLRIATMHRVKGLEFDHVFLVGLNQGVIPLPEALNQVDPDDDLSKAHCELIERCLLYVSMTRAKKTVSLSAHGLMSELIKSSSQA